MTLWGGWGISLALYVNLRGSRDKVQSFLRWLLLRMGWPLARGRFFAPPPAAASSPSELSVSSRSLRSSSTTCERDEQGYQPLRTAPLGGLFPAIPRAPQ